MTLCTVSSEGFLVFLSFLLCGLALSERITKVLELGMTITSTWKQSQKQKGGPPHSKNTNQYSRGKVSKLNNANVEQHQAQIDPPEAERSIQVLGVCGASPAILLFMQPLWLLHFIGAP